MQKTSLVPLSFTRCVGSVVTRVSGALVGACLVTHCLCCGGDALGNQAMDKRSTPSAAESGGIRASAMIVQAGRSAMQTAGGRGGTGDRLAQSPRVQGSAGVSPAADAGTSAAARASVMSVDGGVGSESAPTIVQPPNDVTVYTPMKASFSVAVNGAPMPTIRWQRSTDGKAFEDIDGATSPTYTTPATVPSDNGTLFRAVATNTRDTVASHAATLTVIKSGVGGPIKALAIDKMANLIVGTCGDSFAGLSIPCDVRLISSTGTVTVLAGSTPGQGDGTGANAHFHSIFGIAADSVGSVYVVDWGVNAIRKVASDGVVTTFAGGDTGGGFVDGVGGLASFRSPKSVAVDSHDNVFVTDQGNFAIRKITPSREVTTFAGGKSGVADGKGPVAQFSQPLGIAVDKDDNLYVVDSGSVRKISPAAEVTTLVPASAFRTSTASGSSGPPEFIAIDNGGTIYVTRRQFNDAIAKITPSGTVTTVTVSKLTATPSGIAVDNSGNLYIPDVYGSSMAPYEIRRIAPDGTEADLP